MSFVHSDVERRRFRHSTVTESILFSFRFYFISVSFLVLVLILTTVLSDNDRMIFNIACLALLRCLDVFMFVIY